MLKKLIVPICVSFLCACSSQRDAQTVISDAQEALGNVTSITYSGTAKDVAFQQCGANAADMQCRGPHDPMRPIDSYVRVLDLNAPASRATGVTHNIGPGGSTAVSEGTFFQGVSAQQAAVDQPWGGSLEFYLTPWGFLKGAAENNATLSQQEMNGKMYEVLSWSPKVTAVSGKNYTINGYVNSDNLIDEVETWLGDNIMGDMHIVATYSDWKDFDGVKVPSKIVETRGDLPFFEADITSAEPNPSNVASLIPAPAPKGGGKGKGGPGGPPAMEVTAEKLANGVYRLTTGPGSYDSVIVEFDDHVMMLEAGQSIARGEAYIAKTKELIPNKPITYVFNTHPHSDHTGGLPALVAEGATIITQANNVPFLQKALNTPRTLLDDVLAKNPKEAKFDPVDEKKVYTDGNETVEIYHTWPVPHSNGLLIAYLPKEKILFQGDFSLPAPGEPANDHIKALVPVLENINVLDFDRYINVHTSAKPQHKSELWKAVKG